MSHASHDALRGAPVPLFNPNFDRIVADLFNSAPAAGLSGKGVLERSSGRQLLTNVWHA